MANEIITKTKIMATNKLNKWGFRKELIEMAARCTSLKESTAKKKAIDIFKKYDDLIEYSKDELDGYQERIRHLSRLLQVFKSGKVDYEKIDGTEGLILIKDIEQIECGSNGVNIVTKYGREIQLGPDFKYIMELF